MSDILTSLAVGHVVVTTMRDHGVWSRDETSEVIRCDCARRFDSIEEYAAHVATETATEALEQMERP